MAVIPPKPLKEALLAAGKIGFGNRHADGRGLLMNATCLLVFFRISAICWSYADITKWLSNAQGCVNCLDNIGLIGSV
jgi:hypothetical protein